jgi:hypothetical protein
VRSGSRTIAASVAVRLSASGSKVSHEFTRCKCRPTRNKTEGTHMFIRGRDCRRRPHALVCGAWSSAGTALRALKTDSGSPWCAGRLHWFHRLVSNHSSHWWERLDLELLALRRRAGGGHHKDRMVFLGSEAGCGGPRTSYSTPAARLFSAMDRRPGERRHPTSTPASTSPPAGSPGRGRWPQRSHAHPRTAGGRLIRPPTPGGAGNRVPELGRKARQRLAELLPRSNQRSHRHNVATIR